MGRCFAAVGQSGGKGGAGRQARSLAEECRSTPVRQGFQRHRTITLTIEMHRVPIDRRRRMSTMSRPSADRARALTVRLHSVSSGVGGGMSTSGIGMRGARAATLTVEIHSAASGLRRWISTWEIARFVGPTFALTVRIPWASTGCGGSCPRPDLHCLVTIRAPSPLKTTALRVFEWAGYPHGRALPDVWQRHASKGTDDGQSMPEAAHHPIGRRCSPSKYTVPRVVSADGYPHEHAHRRCSRSCART